ncbi:sodium:proton antiporter [Streptomyces sp. NPDC000618]|uniref:cation:proton antiporter n=1 Tax=Streptomyces sp. NPDC000618 TaxID=3154265 RepID=UPI0033205BE3
MEPTVVAVVGVISMVAVAMFSKRLGLAEPLSLVVVGAALSFVPGVPHVSIEPEWILAGVLPPLLYSAAVNMPANDFRRNFRAINTLAVWLVVVTTLGAGVFFHALVPDIGWPVAFALGAVISPTDAVAATSVGKRLGLPHRLLATLEGEGLVNDASSLVLLRSAVAAMAGTVSLWSVAGSFVYSVVVAVAIGLVIGHVNVRIRARLNDAVLSTAVSFAVPFIAYVPAEELHASGVLATVVTGVVTGYRSPARLRVQDRITETVNWRTVAFLLESGLFLLMGLSLKALIDDASDSGPSVGSAVLLGLAASALVIAVRIVFVAPLVLGLRRQERRAATERPRLDELRARLDEQAPSDHLAPAREERLRERAQRVAADLDFHLNESLGWRGGIVLGWAGMRGAITVAAAQTLPEDTPHRPQLVLIAYVVAVTTLLCQGLSLPMVIRAAKVPGDDRERLREEEQKLFAQLAAAGAAALAGPGLADPDGKPFDPDTVARARSANSEVLAVDHLKAADDGADPLQRQYQQLCVLALDAQRTQLGTARSRGTYSSSALATAQRALDKEEARLQRMRDG